MTERQGIEIDYCTTLPRSVARSRRARQDHRAGERTTPPTAPGSEPRHDPRTEASYPAGYPQAPAYSQYPASGRSPKSPDSPDDFYGREYDPRYQDKKKRKSFLGDLFDF